MQPSFNRRRTPDATHGVPTSNPAPHRHHRTKGDGPATPRSLLRGKPRAQFLLDIPAHEYPLPRGEHINVTIVDLIVLLPQWFRNPGISWRLVNNGISAAVHFAILDQHRHLGLTSAEEAERARDHISDTYRKAIRRLKGHSGWTRAKHVVPPDWDKLNTSAYGYIPEASRKPDYIRPPSVPFKDLAVGLKKLPQGYDAGDLTRALDFAMQHQKLDDHNQLMEFMFPDDIQLILSFIGPTQITQGHVDPVVLDRYSKLLRAEEGARRRQISEHRRQQEAAEEAAAKSFDRSHMYGTPPYQERSKGYDIHRSPLEGTSLVSPVQPQTQPPADFPTSSHGYQGMPPEGMGVLMPATLHDLPMTQASPREVPQAFSCNQLQDSGHDRTAINNVGYSIPVRSHLVRSNSQEAAATVASELVAQGAQQAYVEFPDIPDICQFEAEDQKSPLFLESGSHPDAQRATESLEALMAAPQTYDLDGLPNPVPYSSQARYPYHPSTFLRDCPEGLDMNNHGDLARASRWARRCEYFSNDFKVGDIDLVLSVINTQEAMLAQGGH